MSEEHVKRYPISEMFGSTIQGEGPMIGRKTLFLRFAGCDYHCNWCDSMYTWQKPLARSLLTLEEIGGWMNRARLLTGVRTLTISGGNPALYDLSELVSAAHRDGWYIAVETQGSKVQPWFFGVDSLVVSPKPPSSGMRTDWKVLGDCLLAARAGCAYLKVVVFNDDDYEYAREVCARFPTYPLYLSVGTFAQDRATNLLDRTKTLAELVASDARWATDPFVLPQYHVLLWGHQRGV